VLTGFACGRSAPHPGQGGSAPCTPAGALAPPDPRQGYEYDANLPVVMPQRLERLQQARAGFGRGSASPAPLATWLATFWSTRTLALLHSGQLHSWCGSGSTGLGYDAGIRHSRGMTTGAAEKPACLTGSRGSRPGGVQGQSPAAGPRRATHIQAGTPVQAGVQRRMPLPSGPRRATHIQAGTPVQAGVQRRMPLPPATRSGNPTRRAAPKFRSRPGAPAP
jgi:hypothetical protein